MQVLELEARTMRLLVLYVALCALSTVSSSGVTIGITPYSHPIQSQYQAQDVYGQYSYGYSTPTSSKSEVKLANGVTQGGYSYIDSNGILQTVEYIADPIHGFRVAATNLPQDLPEVAYAKAQHLAQYEATRAEHALIATRVQYSNPVVLQSRAVGFVPAPVQDLPEVIYARAQHLAAVEATRARDLILAREVSLSPVPAQLRGAIVPIHTVHNGGPNFAYAHSSLHYVPTYPVPHITQSSQYQAQDQLGQYSYGYVGPLSSKSETKTADGVVRGGYSYIDANGILQTVSYIADDIHGFRVAATNIPVGPAEIANAAGAPVVVAAPAAVATSVIANPVAIANPTLTAEESPVAVASPISVVTASPAPLHIDTATAGQIISSGDISSPSPVDINAGPIDTSNQIVSSGHLLSQAPVHITARPDLRLSSDYISSPAPLHLDTVTAGPILSSRYLSSSAPVNLNARPDLELSSGYISSPQPLPIDAATATSSGQILSQAPVHITARPHLSLSSTVDPSLLSGYISPSSPAHINAAPIYAASPIVSSRNVASPPPISLAPPSPSAAPLTVNEQSIATGIDENRAHEPPDAAYTQEVYY